MPLSRADDGGDQAIKAESARVETNGTNRDRANGAHSARKRHTLLGAPGWPA